MKENNKDVCPECGKMHNYNDDSLLELARLSAEPFTDKTFPDFWQVRKEELKQLTKKEIAEEAFFSGAMSMLHTYMLTMKDIGEHKEEEIL